MVEAVLRLENLRKRFGGLVVTDNVTLDVLAGELHAVIGPNGAGKTTLINQISGLLACDAGRISFGGHDITHLPAHARAGLGLARSFQVSSVLPGFSALENVALAVQAHTGSSFRFLRASLSHGERRALELAMALATGPKLLLLDEPMAGAGRDESARLLRLLRALKGRFPMVLIEHDMDTVFALADRISVLVYGRVLASGPPAQIRADARVLAAYLGDGTE